MRVCWGPLIDADLAAATLWGVQSYPIPTPIHAKKTITHPPTPLDTTPKQRPRGGDRDRDGEEPAGAGGVVPAEAPRDALLRLRRDRGQVLEAGQGKSVACESVCVWGGEKLSWEMRVHGAPVLFRFWAGRACLGHSDLTSRCLTQTQIQNDKTGPAPGSARAGGSRGRRRVNNFITVVGGHGRAWSVWFCDPPRLRVRKAARALR